MGQAGVCLCVYVLYVDHNVLGGVVIEKMINRVYGGEYETLSPTHIVRDRKPLGSVA